MTNHLEQWELEKAWDSSRDVEWAKFCHEVEKLLGIDNLDGDEANGTDCYSLDSAHDAFTARQTPMQYAARCKAMMLARDRHEKAQADRA